jgi:aminomethyltransferase
VSPKKTGFYDIHRELGAKIVEFAGYEMPIQYAGIMQEHKRVRNSVGLFDVSHMGEFFISGDNALAFLQKITINDVSSLEINQVQYSAMCYENGGIVDDLLVYRLQEQYMVVVNAANLEKDWNWMQDNMLSGVQMVNRSDDLSLLALQGPKAEATLSKLTDVQLADIPFYWLREGKVDGVDIMISRTGYTGEPGFELCFDKEYSEQVWNAIMQAGAEFDIEPIGLASRDTLRLEMKYCLYGNDIDKTTNPIEAGLAWITKIDKGDFIGKAVIRKAKEEGVARKLIAFQLEGKGFPRHDYKIFKDGDEIGYVTSGTFSPMLEKGIGMGYVAAGASKIGTSIEIDIRGKSVPAILIKPPFYKKESKVS